MQPQQGINTSCTRLTDPAYISLSSSWKAYKTQACGSSPACCSVLFANSDFCVRRSPAPIPNSQSSSGCGDALPVSWNWSNSTIFWWVFVQRIFPFFLRWAVICNLINKEKYITSAHQSRDWIWWYIPLPPLWSFKLLHILGQDVSVRCPAGPEVGSGMILDNSFPVV